MGYVPTALSAIDTLVFAEVRGQRLPMRVAKLPFVTPTYQR
jgi:aminomethyltransferase